MTVGELTAGTTRETALGALAGALAGGWLGDAPGAVGVLAGSALAILSFRLLASRVAAATPGAAPWALLAGARFVAVTGVATALFVTGWAHPVAWLAGYSLLPLAVVRQGLRLAHGERRA